MITPSNVQERTTLSASHGYTCWSFCALLPTLLVWFITFIKLAIEFKAKMTILMIWLTTQQLTQSKTITMVNQFSIKAYLEEMLHTMQFTKSVNQVGVPLSNLDHEVSCSLRLGASTGLTHTIPYHTIPIPIPIPIHLTREYHYHDL